MRRPKMYPETYVIRPTLAAPFPGANTVTPTQLATTFYDFRRGMDVVALSSGFPRVGAGPDTSQVLRKGEKVELGPPPPNRATSLLTR